MKKPLKENKPIYQAIPTKLTQKQFNEFILPHLSIGSRGPKCKIPLYQVFNYILILLHTGMQWKNLPIEKDSDGKPVICYTRIFRICQRWSTDGSLDKVFMHSVMILHENNMLDLSVLHGDGSSTPAKKGGDRIGYNGHKHFKGEKVVAIVDRHVNVIAPFITAAGNKNESPLFLSALKSLKKNDGKDWC